MGTNSEFERDLELEQTDAQDVKGGGIVSANASVGGVGSATVDDANTSASAGGASTGTSMSGSDWGAGASGGGQSARAGGKRPRVKRGARAKRSL